MKHHFCGVIADGSAVARDVLAAEGHRVIEVRDGDEAVELCRRYVPDVVVLDMHMPRMGRALERIREDAELAEIPLVCLDSAPSRAELAARVHEALAA
jgi:response regulator NasT